MNENPSKVHAALVCVFYVVAHGIHHVWYFDFREFGLGKQFYFYLVAFVRHCVVLRISNRDGRRANRAKDRRASDCPFRKIMTRRVR